MPYHPDPKSTNGWTFQTMLAHVTSQLEDTKSYILAKLEDLKSYILAIITANDKRYLEMFQASEKATGIAMTASEKAVAAALSAAKEAVSAALAASDRAVQKAEENQLRVNVGQNEFRGQLRDQAIMFATKEVTEAVDRRVQTLEKNYSAGITRQEHEAVLNRIQTIEKMSQGFVTRDIADSKAQAHADDDKRMHAEEDRRLSSLEQTRSGLAGGTDQRKDDRGVGMWKIGITISIIASLMSLLFGLYAIYSRS